MAGSANLSGATITGSTITIPRRLTRLQKALKEVRLLASRLEYKVPLTEENYIMYSIQSEDLIEMLGDLRPIHSGRPTSWAMTLLQAVPAPVTRDNVPMPSLLYMGYAAGMFYTFPSIIGKRKRRSRLSAPALRLLDHYAEKWPSFRPFHAAFVTKKSRQEIDVATYDALSGSFSPAMIDEFDKAAKASRDHVAKVSQAAAMKQAIYQAQQAQSRAVNGPYYAALGQQATNAIGSLSGSVSAANTSLLGAIAGRLKGLI